MMITTRPAIAALEASFEKSGATIPAPLAKALARRTEIVDRFDTRPIPAGDALVVAVLAALENGVDPATDPAVVAVTASRHLAGLHSLAGDLEAILLDGIRAAASSSSRAIHTAWSKAFNKAADALAVAHETLGPIDLADTTTVVKAGPSATAAWSNARDAIGKIEAVLDGWLGLSRLLTGSMPNKRHRLAIIADIPGSTWIDDELDHAAPDPWYAIIRGYKLELATLEDFARRVSAIDQEHRARADATAQASKASLRSISI